MSMKKVILSILIKSKKGCLIRDHRDGIYYFDNDDIIIRNFETCIRSNITLDKAKEIIAKMENITIKQLTIQY